MAAAETALARFTNWLTVFGDSWESRDAGRMTELFTVGATYQPTPFSELVRGRRGIVAHFAARLDQWPGAHFAAQVLGVGDTYGVAHWRVASAERAIDGILLAALDNRGRCTSLREWWHVTNDAQSPSLYASQGNGEGGAR
jgi:hypothetical protein